MGSIRSVNWDTWELAALQSALPMGSDVDVDVDVDVDGTRTDMGVVDMVVRVDANECTMLPRRHASLRVPPTPLPAPLRARAQLSDRQHYTV